MTDVFPQSIQAVGTIRVQLVTAIATPTAPTLTEINATSSLDCTPYFRRGQLTIGIEQAKLDDTRMSDVALRQQLGLAQFNAEDLTYIHNPQAPASTAGNKAYDKLIPGLSAYFVIRFGSKTLLSSAAFVATQRVQVYAVNFGEQHQPVGGNDENDVHTIVQPLTTSRVIGNFTLA